MHHEHRMKVAEKALGKRLQRKVNVNKMQFGCMPERGTIHTLWLF